MYGHMRGFEDGNNVVLTRCQFFFSFGISMDYFEANSFPFLNSFHVCQVDATHEHSVKQQQYYLIRQVLSVHLRSDSDFH